MCPCTRDEGVQWESIYSQTSTFDGSGSSFTPSATLTPNDDTFVPFCLGRWEGPRVGLQVSE